VDNSVTGITAVIATRNRGSSCVGTVRSILRNQHPHFELIVIDQSTDSQTREALMAFQGDPRFRYVSSKQAGLGRAHNEGLRLAKYDYVAITDDDCEVPVDWLATISDVFAEFPRAAVLFCAVDAAPYDRIEGFIPAYRPRGTVVVRSLPGKCRARGIGAGLSVRRSAIMQIGGFDSELGPGARFPACGDGDIAVRAILAGWQVCETDRTAVLHYGFRTWQQGRDLSRRDWLGIGAAYAKPLKCGRPGILVVIAYEFFGRAVWPPINDLLHLRRPVGLARPISFLRGFLSGLSSPVDKRSMTYRAVPDPSEPVAGSRPHEVAR
jgi:GT2 family glycosyltransferase